LCLYEDWWSFKSILTDAQFLTATIYCICLVSGSRSIWVFVFASILILSVPVSHPVYAAPIGPGFDLFQTVPFSHDFGGPIGVVQLEGKPIGPGNTDTIVKRMLPVIPTDPIPIEIVALSLHSVNPINIGGSFFDVFVTINKVGLPGLPQPDVLLPSTGQIMITGHDDVSGGGTFDSFFDVFFDVTLVPTGGDPNDPHQIAQHMDLGPLHLTNTGAPWSHTAPPNYPMDPSYPSGDFFPGPIPHQGMHPVIPAQEPPSNPVGGTIIPIDTTALLLANIQSFSWMIPLVLSGIAIGLFVVSRKSENS